MALEPYTEITQLAISADGKRLATAGFIDGPPRDGGPRYSSVRVWNLEAGFPKSAREYRTRDGELFDTGGSQFDRTMVGLSPNGKTLAAVGVHTVDGNTKDQVVFWSVESKEVLAEIDTSREECPPDEVILGLNTPGSIPRPRQLVFTKDGDSIVFVTRTCQFRASVKDGIVKMKRPIDLNGSAAYYLANANKIVESRGGKVYGNFREFV